MVMEVFLGAVGALAEGTLGTSQLFGATEQLVAGGRPDLAGQLYKLWTGAHPESPILYAVCFNQGVLAASCGDLATAKVAYEQTIAAKSDFTPARINLGSVLERQGAVEDAVDQWKAAVDQLALVTGSAVGLKIMALRQLGRVMKGHGRPDAEAALRQILELDHAEGDVAEHFIALRLLQCKWPVVDVPEGVRRETLLRSMHPLSGAAYIDDPLFHLAQNWNYNRSRIGYKAAVLDPLVTDDDLVRDANPRRLRIGYLSSDLCAHAVGYLSVEAMELHDHDKLEVFVYYCGPPATDWINTRIKAVTDCWVDINDMDDEAAARRIQADGIDILVDLNGNTKGARTKICAMRPAPIIVNWLGFPGTMASPYHHYIIADDWIIPEEHELFVSEKVVRLPCYQPNDRKRQLAPERPTRSEARLPDGVMVYCCFNWTQKISRQIFELWMNILRQVPDSVLWLLDTDEETNRSLTGLAVGYGIAPERLIFGEWMTSPNHLARYPLADVFLDTYPYGAHTTASDALWMGVPIITLSGKSFASRVCGSLARSAGIADLVCSTPEEYVAQAVDLGHNPDRVQHYKKQLEASRDSCVLFDTDLLARRLEKLYTKMWADYRRGSLPRPDLTNLDVYLEAAVENELDAIDAWDLTDYKERFRQKLDRRHRVCPIPADKRLWTKP
jgi:predicted O-linked N-acetylglucosamine transferase (SPINDLY family)